MPTDEKSRAKREKQISQSSVAKPPEFEDIKSYKSWKKHLADASSLKAITYAVSSPEKLLSFVEETEVETAEIVVGDHGTEELKDFLCDDGAGEKIVDDLEQARRDGRLKIWTLAEDARGDIHDKVYVIDEAKVLIGSPNLTEVAWRNHYQKNSIAVIEHPEFVAAAINTFEERKRDYCSPFLRGLTQQIEESDEEREEVIEEWLAGNPDEPGEVGVVKKELVDQAFDEETDELVVQLSDVKSKTRQKLEEHYEPYGTVTSSSIRMNRKGFARAKVEKEGISSMRVKESEVKYINSDGDLISFPREEFSHDSEEKIDKGLQQIETFIEGIDTYGNTNFTKEMKTYEYEALLHFFWAPFIEKWASILTRHGVKELDKHLKTLYLCGETNSGKGTLTRFGLLLITGNDEIDPVDGAELKMTKLNDVKHEDTCFPVVFDDVSKSRVNGCDALKNLYKNSPSDVQLTPIILTSNDNQPRDWVKKRSKILEFRLAFEDTIETERFFGTITDEPNYVFDAFVEEYLNEIHQLQVPGVELHNDRLYETRKVFRKLYDRAGRPLPEYFPNQPAESHFDTVLEDWQEVVVDGMADVVRDENEYKIHLAGELNDDLSRRAELISKLPTDLRPVPEGDYIRIRNTDRWEEWWEPVERDTGVRKYLPF
ncbi:phospholipase D-like domain-containing protein [Natrialbaceae archaeon A-gly3]